MLLLGPLIGSPLIGILTREPLLGLLFGGIVGALVESGLLVIFGNTEGLPPGLGREFVGDWLVLNVFAGLVVGLTFGVLYVLSLLIDMGMLDKLRQRFPDEV
jgi:hypothetical protein